MKRALKLLRWIVTFRLHHGLRERRQARRIADSGVFDPDYYRRCNPDLGLDLDPVTHYVRHGSQEGRNPSPWFDDAFYRARNPDIVAAGHNPFDHFVSQGWREGRDPHPEFDLAFYCDANPEVVQRDLNPLLHYRAVGHERGLETAPAPPPVVTLHRIERPKRTDLAHAQPEPNDPLVVCVAHVVPYPPRAGNHQRLYRYLRWLEMRGYQVMMVSSPLPGEELSSEEIARAAAGLRNFVYCDRGGDVHVSVEPHLEHLLDGLDGMPAPPLAAEAPLHISEAHQEMDEVFCPDVTVRTLLHVDTRLEAPATVVSHYLFSTRFLPHLRPGTRKIIDTIDVFSTKHGKVSAYGIDGEIILSPDEEREFLLRGDVMLAIQPEEARELESLVPDRRVVTAGIDFDPAPEAYAALPADIPPTLLLIASGNALNVKGLRDFLRFAWPLIRRDHPNARLRVGGPLSDHVPAEAPGVEVLGVRDSLTELYRDCHLVINPTVAGTGLKIKTVEALAAHRTIVTWPLGVDGLPREIASLCLVANDWYQFYVATSAMLAEEQRQPLSTAERERVAFALSGTNIYREFADALGPRSRAPAATGLGSPAA